MRSLCQVLLPQLPKLLLIFQLSPSTQMPAAGAVAVKSGQTLSTLQSKQHLAVASSTGSAKPARENVTSSASSAANSQPKLQVVEEVSVEAVPDEVEAEPLHPGKTPATKPLDLKPVRRSRKAAVESAKSAIIREFVASHGDRVRKSRKHADLFDGSGYLIDMMNELHQYESRAEENDSGNHRRKRSAASADDSGSSNDNDNADLPNFSSLSEAFAHLNGGHQTETISADFNLIFVDDDDEKLQEGDDQHESKRLRRRKRSLGNPDDEEGHDDPDWWLRDDDNNPRDNDEAEAEEEESRRQKRAAESIERLDADLKELAKYLDEQAAEERLEGRGQHPLANFNRGMTAAYKNLVQLRGMAQNAAASGNAEPKQPQQQQPQQQQPPQQPPSPRMRDLFPDETANWRIDADVLEETVRDLKKYYRRSDEL